MGAAAAEEFAAAAGEGEISFDAALIWHLTNNHFPAVHTVFVPVAKDAIRRAAADDFDTVLDLPNGRALPVIRIIEQLHLWSFVDNADALPPEDDDDEPALFTVVGVINVET